MPSSSGRPICARRIPRRDNVSASEISLDFAERVELPNAKIDYGLVAEIKTAVASLLAELDEAPTCTATDRQVVE